MLADHLASGDYTVTRIVFVGTLVLAGCAAAVSTLVVKRWCWTRVLGLAFAALVVTAATRMLSAWESITNAADRLTSDGFQFRYVSDFMTTAFGELFVFVLVGSGALFTAAAVIQRHRPEYDDGKHSPHAV